MPEIHYPVPTNFQVAKANGLPFTRCMCGVGSDLDAVSLDPAECSCVACIAALTEQGMMDEQPPEAPPEPEPEPKPEPVAGGLHLGDEADEQVAEEHMVQDEELEEQVEQRPALQPEQPAEADKAAAILVTALRPLPTCEGWKALLGGGSLPENLLLGGKVGVIQCIDSRSLASLSMIYTMAQTFGAPAEHLDEVMARFFGLLFSTAEAAFSAGVVSVSVGPDDSEGGVGEPEEPAGPDPK